MLLKRTAIAILALGMLSVACSKHAGADQARVDKPALVEALESALIVAERIGFDMNGRSVKMVVSGELIEVTFSSEKSPTILDGRLRLIYSTVEREITRVEADG